MKRWLFLLLVCSSASAETFTTFDNKCWFVDKSSSGYSSGEARGIGTYVFSFCDSTPDHHLKMDQWAEDFAQALNDAHQKREWAKKTPAEKCESQRNCVYHEGFCSCSDKSY